MNRGEIWWAAFDESSGHDADGARPCVILSPDDMIGELKTVIVAFDESSGHDADGAATHTPHAGDDTVGGRVGLLAAREEPVFLQLRTRIEQELEPVAYEQLALGTQLVAIARVSLLDPRALLEVAFLTLAHGGLL